MGWGDGGMGVMGVTGGTGVTGGRGGTDGMSMAGERWDWCCGLVGLYGSVWCIKLLGAILKITTFLFKKVWGCIVCKGLPTKGKYMFRKRK